MDGRLIDRMAAGLNEFWGWLRGNRSLACYSVLFLVAVAWLSMRGLGGQVLFQLGKFLFIVLLAVIAFAATAQGVDRPWITGIVPDDGQAPRPKGLGWQMALLVGWILILWLSWWKQVPGATAQNWILAIPVFGRLFALPNVLGNPIQQFLIPMLLLWALRVPLPEMGLNRRGLQAGLWVSLLPGLLAVGFSFTRPFGLSNLPGRLIRNALQNGPMEELLWRGALQGRLERFLPRDVALVLAGLSFGLAHIPAWMRFGVPVLDAAALSVLSQAPIGLVLGVLFARTRSILPGSIVHVVMNSVG